MIFLIKSSGKDILTLDTDNNIVSIPSNNQICVGDIWVNIENKQYFFHQIQDISNPKSIKTHRIHIDKRRRSASRLTKKLPVYFRKITLLYRIKQEGIYF